MMHSTVTMFTSPRVLLFIVVLFFFGMEQGFAGPIYSTTIAFTLKFEVNNAVLIALNFIVQGFGQLSGKYSTSYMILSN